MTNLIQLDNINIDDVIGRASDIVSGGGVVAFPTDTFYGLGCDPFNASAVEKVFAIKKRRSDMPLLLLIDSIETAAKLSTELPDDFAKLAAVLTGPLTIIVPAKDSLPPALTANTGTIGLRLPSMEFACKLASKCGGAITATSANTSGGSNPLTADDVVNQLGDGPDLIIDGGKANPIPSTVITLCEKPLGFLEWVRYL